MRFIVIGKGSTPTDLDQIPAAGIDRIEVLRDGASAQYGSDAIAGVINTLLRTDTTLHATASAGTTFDGGGDTYEASLGVGLKMGEDGFVTGADSFGVFPYSEFPPFGFSGTFHYFRARMGL